MERIILASASPRRRELLKTVGLDFEVIPDDTFESFEKSDEPKDVVLRLAKFKGENVMKKIKGKGAAIIISADTVVAIDNRVIGKPRNEAQAREMLCLLSGNTHSVYTGVYVSNREKNVLFYEKTDVRFRRLGEREIEGYIKTGEPMDKAGSYGIQGLGSMFVESVCGDFFNVVGLPVCRLCEVLREDFNFSFFN